MAFDFASQESGSSMLLSQQHLSYPKRMRELQPAYCKTALKWRQTVLSIVYDALGQLEPDRPGENDHIWRREAQQRALNFAKLGLCEISVANRQVAGTNRPGSDIAAIATLGGAYRLLARNNGTAAIECEHIFRSFLINLAAAYGPACGKTELELELCPILLPPIKCRALVLCAGTLIQAMLPVFSNSSCNATLEIKLTLEEATEENAARYVLALQLKGKRVSLNGLPEFDLAARLCGIFQSELLYSDAQDDGVTVWLRFPVPTELR